MSALKLIGSDGEGTASELTPTNIAWVAGIVEGEGSLDWENNNLAHNARLGLPPNKVARVRVGMTDEDIIRRLHALTGIGRVHGPYQRKQKKVNGDNTKPIWEWKVSKMVDAIGLMMTLYPFLGERRRAKVREIIEQWKVYAPTRGRMAA